MRHGIGIVFQELNLFGNLSVAENIFATREITRGLRGIDHKAQVEKANEFLNRLEAGISADTLMRMLSAYEMAEARVHEGEIVVARIAKAA